MNRKNTLMTVLKTVMIPFAVFLIFECIDRGSVGLHLINTSADVATLLRNLVTSFGFALALNTNLSCGRMDLSLGAQMYLGVIFGGLLAIRLGLGGIGMIVFALLIGAAAGFVSGFLFTTLRILPMILGLAMTLVYECMSYSVNHQQGVVIFGQPGFSILSNIPFIVAVLIVLILITMYIFQYSLFGYRRRAIQGSQKLASDAGINIFANCIFCYMIAGALAALSGVFDAAFMGSLAPVLGMSSNTTVFANMFPMVLGAWIGSFSNNQSLGIFMGALSVRFLILGIARLGLGSSVQNLIVYSLFLVFVVVNTNRDKPAYLKAKRERIAQARKMREEINARSR